METQKAMSNTIEDIVLLSVVILVRYSERINDCVNQKDISEISELYPKLVANDYTEEELLIIISDYLSNFYLHIEHFQKRELFESCDILSKAMKKELEWNIKYVLKNFEPEFINQIQIINDQLKEYYLAAEK